MIPTQPKRGEVARWMIWVLVLAVMGLCGTVAYLYKAHREEIRAKDAELSACLREQAQIQREFREELSQVFERVNQAIQEVERAKRKQKR